MTKVSEPRSKDRPVSLTSYMATFLPAPKYSPTLDKNKNIEKKGKRKMRKKKTNEKTKRDNLISELTQESIRCI